MMTTYRNHYHHERCGTSWQDVWSCECNDRCPVCNIECTPTHSEELEPEEGLHLTPIEVREVYKPDPQLPVHFLGEPEIGLA